MKTIFYQMENKPIWIDIEKEKLVEATANFSGIIKMICGVCVVWNGGEVIPKDRTQYHRNVCITRQNNGVLKTEVIPLYNDFYLCGYDGDTIIDFPVKYQNEFLAMFGY